jgi:cytochrome c oxidase accessory protein FixG
MCPYSRFQGVMFDPQTLNVGYDVLRGEPRGARREDGSANSAISAVTTQRKGDCVDCTLCVQVCPTGIDIRQGLQYACISCGLCIDACNKVMDKIGLARGLIRFDSLQRLEQGIAVPFRFWRPRVIAYTALISAMAVALVVGLAQRIPLRVDVLRERNALAREVDDGWVENIYTVKLANMAEMPRRFKLAVSGLPDAHIEGPDEIASGPGELTPVVLTVRARPEQEGRHARPLTLDVTALDAPNQVHVRETTPFLLP